MKIIETATLLTEMCTGFYEGGDQHTSQDCELPIMEGCLKIGHYFLSAGKLKELAETLNEFNNK